MPDNTTPDTTPTPADLAEFDLVLERVWAIPGVRTTQTNLLFSSLRTV